MLAFLYNDKRKGVHSVKGEELQQETVGRPLPFLSLQVQGFLVMKCSLHICTHGGFHFLLSFFSAFSICHFKSMSNFTNFMHKIGQKYLIWLTILRNSKTFWTT